ncbi:MAG: SUMF1/EgtB/PvdO family nonheme iron enzyme [Lewinellaceae bacterium]|nr:SUMF1/EgtB/PvdO family nonheme iron enzyme [Lewinellaceae bacterium]
MDPARRFRLWRVLEQQGGPYLGRWDELKYLLAPYVARTAEEQRLFYQIFEQFQGECEAEAERRRSLEASAGKGRRGQRRSLETSTSLALLLLAGLAVWWLWPRTVDAVPVQISAGDPQVREGAALYLENTTIIIDPADSAGFRWEVRDAETGAPVHEAETFHLRWPVTGTRNLEITLSRPAADSARFMPWADTLLIEVLCANPPRLDSVRRQPNDEQLVQNREYAFSVPPQEGVLAEWVFAGRDTLRGFEVRHSFSEVAADARYRLRLYREGDYAHCYTVAEGALPVQSDKPFLATQELRPDRPRVLLAVKDWLLLLALLPFLAQLYMIYRWWQEQVRKRRVKTAAELEAEYPIHDRAPYFIPYLPHEEKIQAPPDFFRIADVLRRREAGQRRVFDAPGTVRATVQAGGFPTWQDRPLTRPAEYLFLLPQRDERHQQDLLFRRLAAFLQQRDAPVLAFFHRGDFGRVWNGRHPDGLTLEQLHRQYPSYRLVVLGDGHGLVNPYATRKPALLAGPLRDLERWPRRLLLTPEPVADWSFQEALLYRHFRLYPADTAGLLAGVEALDLDEEYMPGSFEFWQNELLPRHADPSCRYRDWGNAEEHRACLADDPALFRWLCGLAVNAQPDWALTIAIGRALGIDVTHDRLLRLSRIPWLAGNQPDTTLRLELLRRLSREDERLARRAVSQELELVREQVAESFAQTDWTSSLAVQRFALNPRDEANKHTIRYLKQLGLLSGDQIEELEFTIQERLASPNQKSQIANQTSQIKSLDAWLETEEPQPVNARLLFGSILLFLLSFAVLGWAAYYNSLNEEGPARAFWQQAQPLNDEALELHNQAVGISQRLAGLTSYGEWAVASADSMGLADTLFRQAIARRAPEAYPLADSNRFALAYDYGARRLNFYFSDSSTWQEARLARPAFERAMELLPDTLDPRYHDALHALGLADYYESQYFYEAEKRQGVPDAWFSAHGAYNRLLRLTDSTYFERIREAMPVNLETLLGLNPPRLYLIARFLDAETGQPVPGAAVLLPGGARAADASGWLRYRFAEEPPLESGALRLRVQADGYREQEHSFRLQGRPQLANEVRLYPRGSASVWSGRVLDAQTGKPIAQATVQAGDANRITDEALRTSGGPLSARTGVQGYFTMEDIPPEAYQLQVFVQAEGYRDTLLRVGLPEDGFVLRLLPAASAPLGGLDRDTAPDIPMPEMAPIPGGTFTMGCLSEERDGECYDDEKPAHEVTVSSFYMSRHEVTNGQFAAFLNEEGNREEGRVEWINLSGSFQQERCRIKPEKDKFIVETGYERHPVIYVSWYGARAYAAWLSKKTGRNYRLPTEAEWEYAARGGEQGAKDNYLYSGSDSLDLVAWHAGNSDGQVHPVGLKKANQLGLFDMSGNVWEWCADVWHDNYQGAPRDGSAWVSGGDQSSRVVRGGSWGNVIAWNLRVPDRNRYASDYRNFVAGFRVAQD